jgi:hypothetical protein
MVGTHDSIPLIKGKPPRSQGEARKVQQQGGLYLQALLIFQFLP